MADSQTQEKVREAIAELTDDLQAAEDRDDDISHVFTEDLRTLLAAYTRMEADLAEARKLMKPFAQIGHAIRSVPSPADKRALAAFYNKGEE